MRLYVRMEKEKTYNRKKIFIFSLATITVLILLIARLFYVMIIEHDYYTKLATELHERERAIKALRGEIIDRNNIPLATNITVCTVSVIHNQITDEEQTASMLSSELGISYEDVLKKVKKKSSIERIKTNVEKTVGDRIREYGYSGVKVDEDYKRYYPYDELASKVIGFTGSDNQGIVGLEVYYDEYLTGKSGNILTVTDAKGIELEGYRENREEPIAGNTLKISIDYNIQRYCEQAAYKVMTEKNAKNVIIIVMNPVNGEIYAMVNTPEYNLNQPFELTSEYLSEMQSETTSESETIDQNKTNETAETMTKQDMLNQMWRCMAINDTYEPGSTFKMITAAGALEDGVVSITDTFTCCGYATVEDRRIRCHKTTGHGTETFTETVMNSCNPAFIEWGRRLGTDRFYEYFKTFGLMEKTGIDLPGEASGIMHKKENIGAVELATISFGQSFQITPMQLLGAAASIVNGGHKIIPHFGIDILNEDGKVIQNLNYTTDKQTISKETSDTMKEILWQVVENGGGNKAYIEGYEIGGKTATSQKLPRGSGKYIASFVGFVPYNDPKVMAMCIINEPQGVYYGGTIAAPVIQNVFDNILPYLGMEKNNNS